MAGYLRGQIAKMTNIHFETLRYYEKQGLIPTPERNSNGYRIYSEEVVSILEFIKSSKESGMSNQEIRALLTTDIQNVNPEMMIQSIADKIVDIDFNIAKLVKMRTMLQELKEIWERQGICPGILKFAGVTKKK